MWRRLVASKYTPIGTAMATPESEPAAGLFSDGVSPLLHRARMPVVDVGDPAGQAERGGDRP